MFAQFFNNNAAFECLEVDGESVDKLRAIVSLLQRCSSLKELILVNENAWSQCGRTGESVCYINRVDTVLEALIGHTGLRKLTIADAKIGVGGSNSLAMILHNPTINLTSLSLNATKMYDSRRSYRDLDYYFNHDKDSEFTPKAKTQSTREGHDQNMRCSPKDRRRYDKAVVIFNSALKAHAKLNLKCHTWDMSHLDRILPTPKTQSKYMYRRMASNLRRFTELKMLVGETQST
jgi:hypothetical protein